MTTLREMQIGKTYLIITKHKVLKVLRIAEDDFLGELCNQMEIKSL